MSILSLHRPRNGPSGHSVARIAMPFAGVVAGTAAGFVIAAVAHRTRPGGRTPLELAPDGSALEFHEGGVRVSRRGGGSGPDGAGEVAPIVAAGDLAGLGSAGIRPTFEVEDELAREVDVAGNVDAGPGSDGLPPEGDPEPVLSARRA